MDFQFDNNECSGNCCWCWWGNNIFIGFLVLVVFISYVFQRTASFCCFVAARIDNTIPCVTEKILCSIHRSIVKKRFFFLECIAKKNTMFVDPIESLVVLAYIIQDAFCSINAWLHFNYYVLRLTLPLLTSILSTTWCFYCYCLLLFYFFMPYGIVSNCITVIHFHC